MPSFIAKSLKATVCAMLFALAFSAQAQELELDQSPTSASSIKLKPQLNKQLNTPASDESAKNFDYAFLGGFGGNFYGDEKQQEQSAAAVMYVKANYKPISFAEFDLFAGLNLITGHAQYRYGDSEEHSGFVFKEASVSLTPIDHTKISLGALYVQDVPVPSMLISEFSFPGVKEEILFGTPRQHINFFAQQMIPTSTSLSTQTAEQEATPGFYTEGIDARTPIFTRELLGSLYAGHFKFNNLPSAVANQSALFGNTVTDGTAISSLFTYQYEGYYAGGELEWRINRRFKVSAGDHVLVNNDAPEENRYGQLGQFKVEYRATSDLVITPIFETYFNESDSSPAAFNSAEYGHNNMQGVGGHLRVDFPREHFYARADYYNSNVINRNSLQYDQQFFFLRFVAEYGNTKLFD